jgi:hypothetical protein
VQEKSAKEDVSDTHELNLPLASEDFAKWAPNLSTVGCIHWPFWSATMLFLSFASHLFTFFELLTDVVEEAQESDNEAILRWFFPAIVLFSTCTSAAVFIFGWEAIGKQIVYYRLLEYGIIMRVSPTKWYCSPPVWCLLAMLMCSLGFWANGASVTVTLALCTILITVASLYNDNILNQDLKLLPMNEFTKGGLAAFRDWLGKAHLVSESQVLNIFYDARLASNPALPGQASIPLHDDQPRVIRELRASTDTDSTVSWKCCKATGINGALSAVIFDVFPFYVLGVRLSSEVGLPTPTWKKQVKYPMKPLYWIFFLLMLTLSMGSGAWFYGYYVMFNTT